jgi:hypothetical protein
MKQIIESALEGNLQLERETLSDGSRAYNIIIGTCKIACEGFGHASDIFWGIIKLANPSNMTSTVGEGKGAIKS